MTLIKKKRNEEKKKEKVSIYMIECNLKIFFNDLLYRGHPDREEHEEKKNANAL